MKKLLIILFLVVVLSVTFAVPAYAGDPPKMMPDGSMPDECKAGLEKAKIGITTGYPQGWLWGIVVIRDHLLQGYIPRSPLCPHN
jgi:hypothetical protein